MNHIYKSIFNKALGVFTAVPEFASAHGKGSERTVVGRVAKGTAGFAASALAISVGLALTSTSVMAAPGIYVNDGTDPGCLALPDLPAPYTGIYGIGTSGSSISAGNTMVKPGYTIAPDSYFGLDQMKPCLSSGDGVHAAATQTNRTLFYGNTHTVDTSNNGAKNLTLGGRLDVNSGIIGVGDRGVNGGSGATNSIRMGTGTTLDEANKVVNGISIGVDAGASAVGSTAIGANAKARAEYSVALGDSAVSGDNTIGAVNGGGGAIAIGRQSMANNYNAIAIGLKASVSPAAGVTSASDGIAIGSETVVDNYKGIAVGAYSQAKGRQSTVIANNVQGSNYSTASGTRSQVYGAETNVSGNNSVAIGDTNTVASDRTYVMGNNINAPAGTQNSLAFGTRASVGGASSIAMGLDSKTNTDGSIAMGLYSEAGGPITNGKPGINATAIGTEAKALGLSAVAMGYRATVENGHDSIAIGVAAKSTNKKSTAIGTLSEASGEQSTVISNNYDAKGGQSISIASGRRSQIYGSETTVSGEQSVAIGDTNTVASARTYAMGNNINVKAGINDALAFGTRAAVGGANAIALGNTAKATKENTIAQGTESVVYGKNSVSIGYKAVSGIETPTPTQTNAFSVSIGNETEAIDASTIAIGDKAKAKGGVDALAVGTQANAMTYKALAIGAYSQATGRQSTVIGNDIQGQPSIASGTRSQILGVQSNVSGDNSVSIGDTNTVASARTYALGNNINAAAGTDDSLAFGTRAHVSGANQVSIGTDAGADNTSAGEGNTAGISIGNDAGRYATAGKNNTSIGQRAGQYANGDNNVAIGKDAGSLDAAGAPLTTNTVSIGSSSKVKGQEAIAVGNEAEAISNSAIAIGNSAKGRALYSTAIGLRAKTSDDATMTFGESATAVGHAAAATRYSAAAFGHDSFADGESSVALGYAAKALGTEQIAIGAHAGQNRQGTQTGANFSVAIGRSAGGDAASALGNHSGVSVGLDAGRYLQDGSRNTAVGGYAGQYVKGSYNVALGHGAGSGTATEHLEASETISIGHNSKASAAYSTAIGTNANAAQANSVALGAGSTTSDVHTGDYTLNGSYTAAGLPKVANGTVSVGAVGKERQIQNVAAGVISATSTDAINGSQLYATNNYLSNLAGGVKNVLGGDAAVDNAGNLTMSDVGGTGKGNVHEAIAAVKGVADTAVQEVESENPTALSVKKDGTKVTLTPNFITGDLVNADGTVNAPATADEGKLVSAKTVADALKANHFVVDTKGNTETGSEADAKVGSGNKVTFEAGNNLVAKQANTANGGATVKFSLKDDISLNSVTAGTGANQVVLGNDGVKVGGNTYINNDGLNANSKVISNVADGVAPTDAVNKGQLDAVKGVADSAVKSVDTVASEENLVVDNNDPQNPKLRLKKAVNLTSIKLDGATPGHTTYVSGYGLTIEDGPSVKKEGINAGDKKITNVAAGDVSATSKDAVNGGQLHNVATSVANVLGGNAAVDGNGNVTSSDIGGTGANTVDDAIKAVNATAAKHTTVVEGKNVKVTKGKNAAGGDEYTVATKDDLDVTSVTAGNTTVNTNGLTITGGPSVTRGGIDAGNAVITNVRDGKVEANSKDAVNGGQLHATNTKLDGVKAKADTAVQDVKSGDENALTAVKDPNTNIVTVTPKLSGDLVDANGNITAPTTPAEKGKLVTAGTVAQALANTHFVVDTKATDGELDAASQADQKIKAGNKVTLQAGKNLKAKQTNGANGAQVEFSLKDSISLTEVTAGTGDNQVVLGNNGVQVGGNTYINKDGLNANSKVISNVADGVNPNDAVNKGQLDAVKGVADSAVKSVDVANGEQNLVVDNTDPKNPKLSLKKDLTVDSVKAGDSTLNTDGLTIAGGPSVKKDGINAGNKKITGVADGNVAAGSTDAVNGGQLYNVANNVKDLIGPDAAIDPATGKVTVADPAKGIGETGKGTIGDAIKHVNDAAKAAADTAKKHTTVEQGDNIVVEESLNADGGKHYKVSTAKDLNVDSVKAGDTTVNNDGVTIAGGPSVTKGGINAGGNTITNVADGVNPNDAVNKGQLDAVKGVADSAVKSVKAADGEQNLVVDNTDPKNPKLSLKKDLTVDSVKAGDSTLNNDGLTIAGGPSVKKDGIDAGDKKITNVAAGDVAENSKDAVNGGQLHNVAKGVADVLGGDAAVDGDGKVTMTNIGETGKGNVNDAIKHVNDAVKAAADTAKKHTTVEQGDNIVVEESTNAEGGKHYKVSTARDLNVDSVKAGDTTVNNDGVTIAGGPSVTKGGINAGGNTITNVADGVNPDDAVNKGQLDKVDTKVSNVAQNVVNVLGGDATVNGNGDITMSNIGETGKGNINDAIKSVNDLAKKAAAEKTSVKAKEGRSNVTVTEGVNAAGGHEYTVDVERSVTNAGSDYVTVTNNHDADSNTTTYTVDVSAKTKASLAKADSAVQGLTSKDGNLNFTKGANGNVEVSFNDNLNVKNVTTDRVQVANGPSMSKDGINAAGKAISNVANGNVAADSKDAVNGGQLHETAKSVADVIGGGATVKDGKVVAGQNGIGNTGQNTVHGAIAAINQNTANNFNQIRGDLRKMDRDLRGGIAGALATAGLPQAFRPGKSMVAAAASTYRGQSGLAIGVSRISDNGKVILKVTGNTNSRGDFGGTIGAGYQW